MLAILDTSVLVAGLRSNRGASFQIIHAIRAGDLKISVSVPLVLEYEAFLHRPGIIPGFSPKEISQILDAFCLMVQHQKVFFAWRPFLKDSNDDLVLELAVAASAPISSRTIFPISSVRTHWEFEQSNHPQLLK